MRCRKNAPRRPNFDYRSAHWYFVTMVTADRDPWLARIDPSRHELTHAGRIAAQIWLDRPTWFPGVQLDAFVLMPDHVHAIVALPGRGVALGRVVGTFKAATTRAVSGIVGPQALWQRSFWDRIVRNEADLRRFRNYVRNNPRRAMASVRVPAGWDRCDGRGSRNAE